MGFKVELISKLLIKPSSPTPSHLSQLQFSLTDQQQYIVSMPFVLFYKKSNNLTNLQTSHLLKQSLSKALTIFYPLAVRINNYSYTNCNDEGALLIETQANCQLSDILKNRNQYHIHAKKFIPLQPYEGIHQYGSLFQITYFNCGGLAISFAMPHMLGDGVSYSMFLNGWAAIAKGNAIATPSFGTSSIYPPRKLSASEFPRVWVSKKNFVTKSFVFDAFTLSALKNKYSDGRKNLSRMQALSVFISSRIMRTVAQAKEGVNKNKAIVVHMVNLRPLLALPNSKRCFGNLIAPGATVIDTDKEEEFPRMIRDSIKSVNADSVKKLPSGQLVDRSTNFFIPFSSLCNFPIYEIDFGWGKPEWIAFNGMFFENCIIFADTKKGRGIEAWINLTEEDMAKFENDELLLSHISSNPNGNPNFNMAKL